MGAGGYENEVHKQFTNLTDNPFTDYNLVFC